MLSTYVLSVLAVLFFANPHIANADPSVSGNVIHWPDDGWYQVQDATTYTPVCAGGQSCTVEPGRYIVINHTTGERYNSVHVPASISVGPVVSGNTIHWYESEWYQVQRASDYATVCEGGQFCVADPGVYIVINHTSGERFERVEIPGETTTSVIPDSFIFSRSEVSEFWWVTTHNGTPTRHWISASCAAELNAAVVGGDWFAMVSLVPDSNVSVKPCPLDSEPVPTEDTAPHSPVTPFVSEPLRGAGPPSAPENLKLLLSSEEWIEFSWDPSSDDREVDKYIVYRDGSEIFTVRGDTGYEPDYRSWINTSFIDCNRTRYSHCDTIKAVPGNAYSYTVVAADDEGMSSGHSVPAIFTFEEKDDSAFDLDSYFSVFSEEFDGESLDFALWKAVLPWGEHETVNGELQHYVNIFNGQEPAYNPFVFTGNTLQITGIETPLEMASLANNKEYLSGVMTTSDHFEMTYGYVEMNAKLAGGQGVLSSFYLFNQYWDKIRPEIDVIEYLGAMPDQAYQTYHYYEALRDGENGVFKHTTPTMLKVTEQDLSADFHTYGVLWEPGFVAWYIDGEEIQRMSGPSVPDEPMNIIVQLIIGSDWIGAPDDSSIPAVLEIDYIRAWQK